MKTVHELGLKQIWSTSNFQTWVLGFEAVMRARSFGILWGPRTFHLPGFAHMALELSVTWFIASSEEAQAWHSLTCCTESWQAFDLASAPYFLYLLIQACRSCMLSLESFAAGTCLHFDRYCKHLQPAERGQQALWFVLSSYISSLAEF